MSKYHHWLYNLSGKKILVPLYHCVAEVNPPHIRNLYKIRSLKQFELEIDKILQLYEPVTVGLLRETLRQNREKPIVHFTFDDGFRACYDIIMPILLRKGIPATFFINSATIDNKELMFRCKASLLCETVELQKKVFNINYKNRAALDDWAEEANVFFDDYLKKEQPYLNEDQLRSLVKHGFSLGSHSIDHPYYHEISLEEQIRQTVESQYFVRKFYQKERLFAFPFTDYKVERAFFEAVIPTYIDMSFGTAGFKDDTIAQNIQRMPMEKYPPITNQSDFLTFEQIKYMLKRIIGKNRIYR